MLSRAKKGILLEEVHSLHSTINKNQERCAAPHNIPSLCRMKEFSSTSSFDVMNCDVLHKGKVKQGCNYTAKGH